MKIIYSPFYNGNYYLDMKDKHVAMDVQVLETQGLLSQLAMHAGIHQQAPSYPERLTAYHKALLEYNKQHENNQFHKSILIDSMSVAKTLLGWRDYLAMCGWNSNTKIDYCPRLNTLADIDSYFEDEGIAVLLLRLMEQIQQMESGTATIPNAYKSLVIEVPCQLELLPDYIQPLINSLENIGVQFIEKVIDKSNYPEHISEIHFTQQWKAEAWLSQQLSTDYDVWINSDNKRLDNWLHMSGNPVCGSEMTNANPQITQMFLLAIQLFQRPLNVNSLLQYLFLPECPLDRKLCRELAKNIVNEGGFCNEPVQNCINDYIIKEFKDETDNSPQEKTKEQREEEYIKYLPFDLRNDECALPLVEETEEVNIKGLTKFLNAISSYASNRAVKIEAVLPYDARIAQLRVVVDMTDALLDQIEALIKDELSFKQLIQWAQSLYDNGNFQLYNAQVNSRCMLSSPGNMIDKADRAIWCDFYGDVASNLSTDFLSIKEQESLKSKGILIWNKQNETELKNEMLIRPIYMTDNNLTIITCDQQGATKLPQHPLYLQLPVKPTMTNGDNLYLELSTKEILPIDNHRDSDNKEICFDAKNHPVKWRPVESYSALEKLLQNPFDYFMNYTLNFTDISETDIKLSLTYGNVAHEVVENLFTADRNGVSLEEFIKTQYDYAFNNALVKKGAILLLPEHHLDKDRIKYLLKGCVNKLAALIQENNLTVIQCEQKEEEDLGFEGGIILKGFIDMLLRDKEGNDVVFDLKYVSKKDKFKTYLEKNRALQLAIYKAMLMNQENHSPSVRTAYFVMPYGILFSTDDFIGPNFEKVTPKLQADIMDQVRKGYSERIKEINSGFIETADNELITELRYGQKEDVYPLDCESKRNGIIKVENKYSDYKCFTI